MYFDIFKKNFFKSINKDHFSYYSNLYMIENVELINRKMDLIYIF